MEKKSRKRTARRVRHKRKRKKPNLQTFLLNIYAGRPMPDGVLSFFQPQFLQ
jgi:hypothetical protein